MGNMSMEQSKTYIAQREKNGSTSFHVTYSYKTKDQSTLVQNFMSTDYISENNYYDLDIGQHIIIVYNADDPNMSMPKLILHEANEKFPSAGIKVVIAIFFGTFLFIISPAIYKFYNERKILRWGQATMATIGNEEEYNTKLGRYSKVTYSFKDDRGQIIVNKRKGVPAASNDRDSMPSLRAVYIDNPTAVFDPNNSKRNILYPASIAKVQQY